MATLTDMRSVDGSISLRQWTDADVPALLRLAAAANPRGEAADPAFFDWCYRRHPTGRAAISCAFRGDQLVGMVANISMPLARGGQTVSACMSINGLTARAFRGLGVFRRAGEHVCDTSLRGGVDCVLGLPSPAALGAWRKLGHRELGRPKVLAYPLRPTALALKMGLGRQLSVDPLDAVWRRLRRSADHAPGRNLMAFDGVRTGHLSAGAGLALGCASEWLQWRYFDVPTRSYDAFYVGDPGQPEGVAICRTAVPAEGRIAGVPITYLMDLLLPAGAPAATANSLIGSVIHSAAVAGSAAVLALVSGGSARELAYRAAGFVALPQRVGWRGQVIVRDDGRCAELRSLDDLEVSFGMTDAT